MDERREGMKELIGKIDSIIEKQAKIKSYIENQFGGEDLVGNATEGIMTRQVRELNEKVKIQNGRIGKLEVRYWLAVGGGGVILFLIELYFKFK